MLAAFVLWGTFAPPAHAQTADPVTDARIQIGPVGLTPRFFIRDVGVDTNVLNSAGTRDRDFVATLGPGAEYWMRVGKALLNGQTTLEYLYFQRFETQRAFNLDQSGKITVELARLTPYVEGSYLRTRRRPNFEIDERILQENTGIGFGASVAVGGRTSLELLAREDHLRFGDESEAALAQAALDRNARRMGLGIRVALTGLTTWSARVEQQSERFQNDGVRDSDSLVASTMLEFRPSAFVSGSARIGYRDLQAVGPETPDFHGVIAAVDLAYVLLEQTRFAVRVNRDIEYSFDEHSPYYVQNGIGLEVKQAIGFVWDVVARANRTTLDYSRFSSSIDEGVGERRDRVEVGGLGVGRHLGDNLRLGFDVNHERRRSPVAGRTYQGYRLGGSITYGF